MVKERVRYSPEVRERAVRMVLEHRPRRLLLTLTSPHLRGAETFTHKFALNRNSCI
jgi:transposase-like protein